MGELEKVRINKYLAERGYATRRGADKLIEKGAVMINGKRAVLGDRVSPTDTVTVSEDAKKEYRYVAYHKRKGELLADNVPPSMHSTKGSRTKEAGLFPVGRLDKASSGLVILTNDGRVTDRLLNPKNGQEREYTVTVDKKITNHFRNIMARGVDIEGYRTSPGAVHPINDTTFSITITEGKKHQIKRMCAALGYTVKDLRRTRIVNITLGTLQPGGEREINGPSLRTFLSALGL